MKLLCMCAIFLAVAYTAQSKGKFGDIRPGGRPCWKMMFCKEGFEKAEPKGISHVCSVYNGADCYWYKVYKSEGQVCEARWTKITEDFLNKYMTRCKED